MDNRLKGLKYFTHEVQELFLNQLVEAGGNVNKALNGIPISRAQLMKKCKESSDFNTRYNDAMDLGIGELEDEAIRRAKDGVTEDKYYKTKKIGVKRTYSDTLMKFILEGRRREVYGKVIKLEGGDNPLLVGELPKSLREKVAEIQDNERKDSEQLENDT